LKPSICFFVSHPIQYISPLLKELANEADLEVYYYSDVSIMGGYDKGFGKEIKWDTPLLEGYKSAFLKNFSKNGSMNSKMGDAINPGVIKVLWKSKSKVVVVNSWTYFSDWLVILTAWIFGKKVWLRAENPMNQENLKKGWKKNLKYYFLKFLIFKIFIKRFLFIGLENRKFFIHYGVLESKLIYTPYAVDNKKFSNDYNLLKSQIKEIKKELNIPFDYKVILFSGKFIEKKRPIDLLKAFESLKKKKVFLIFIGEGILRETMEKYIFERKIKNVLLTGFVNQFSVSKYYSIADVFVMCSGVGETWGLSVNEAMNFKLPVILSKTTGSSQDLVENGYNGYVFDEGDFMQLGVYLNEILFGNFDLERAGKISFKIIQEYSIELIVKNIKLALEK